MRKTILSTLAVGMLVATAGVASAQSTTERRDRARSEQDSTKRRDGHGVWRGQRGGAGPMMGVGMLRRLPENLKLTADQESRVKALTDAFRATHKADLDALAETHRKAREARQAGQSREQMRQLLEQTAPARERLRTAGTELRTQIDAVLTAEQRQWLESRKGEKRERPARFDRSGRGREGNRPSRG
jgi:Spy/CpxP family protein refolding chaperone